MWDLLKTSPIKLNTNCVTGQKIAEFQSTLCTILKDSKGLKRASAFSQIPEQTLIEIARVSYYFVYSGDVRNELVRFDAISKAKACS